MYEAGWAFQDKSFCILKFIKGCTKNTTKNTFNCLPIGVEINKCDLGFAWENINGVKVKQEYKLVANWQQQLFINLSGRLCRTLEISTKKNSTNQSRYLHCYGLNQRHLNRKQFAKTNVSKNCRSNTFVAQQNAM